MNGHDQSDPGLQTLLDLDGEVFPMENSYWTEYEFESAGQLMEDFWAAVDEIVKTE